MEDKKRKEIPREHRLELIGREHLTIQGVDHVANFDEHEIGVETSQGFLTLKGNDLHINHLSLEDGTLLVEGFIKGMIYSEEGGTRGKGKGLIERLLK